MSNTNVPEEFYNIGYEGLKARALHRAEGKGEDEVLKVLNELLSAVNETNQQVRDLSESISKHESHIEEKFTYLIETISKQNAHLEQKFTYLIQTNGIHSSPHRLNIIPFAIDSHLTQGK